MLSDAYLAGIFDAEGCISTASSKRLYLKVHLACNTDSILEEIRERFSGSLHTRSTGMKGWSTTTQQAKDFLEVIYPYLFIKKDLALLGIQLQDRTPSEEKPAIAAAMSLLIGRTSPSRRQGMIIPPLEFDPRLTLNLEYLAGFFDGEGCISCSSIESNGGYAMTHIANSCLEILQLIKKDWGGSLYVRKRGKSSMLTLSPTAGKTFVEAVYPYLIIKKPVATYALELMSLPRGNPRSYERENLRQHIHRLNSLTSPSMKSRGRFANRFANVERLEALHSAGVDDKTVYKDPASWQQVIAEFNQRREAETAKTL